MNLYHAIYNTQSQKAGQDVDYTIFSENNITYLLFEGSNSTHDWFVDFDFPVKTYKSQKIRWYVHGGFGKVWKSANDEIMKNLIYELSLHPSNSVTIAGHSFGGAMAILAAEDFHFRTRKKADVITMGCPRIIFGERTRKYLKACINTIKQYENYNDIVPKLPFFYKHLNITKMGEKFTLLKMILHGKDFHCSY